MPKLTKRIVEGMEPGATDRLEWDTELPGFGVRVKPSGVRSYLIQYRNAHGRSKRFTIGRHGVMTVEEARREARLLLLDVARGIDPAADRAHGRAAPTVSDLATRYLREYVAFHNRETTAREVARLVEKRIRPALGALKVEAVTRAEIARFHGAMAATPRQANFALSVLSKMFALAEDWGLRPENSNPCRRLRRFPETKRDRFLKPEEVETLLGTLRLAETEGLPWGGDPSRPYRKHARRPENRRTMVPPPAADIVRVLLFTGCRLGEVLTLRWDAVDFAGRRLRIDRTKNGRPHVVALTDPVEAILRRQPGPATSPWVFPKLSDPSRPFPKETMEQIWQRVRAAAGLEDVRLHDLRHTFGTWAGQTGANAFLVRDLLGHRTLEMTGRYVNRDVDPLRAMSETVAARLASFDPATGSDPPSASERPENATGPSGD